MDTRRTRPRLLALLAAPVLAAGLLSAVPVTAGASTVTVRPGDSLWAIAQRTGTTVAGLRAANPAMGPVIHPGQTLRTRAAAAAPTPSRSHVVRAGDSLWGIARRHGVPLESLLAANGLRPTSLLLPGRALRIPGAGATPGGRATPGTGAKHVGPVARQDGFTMAEAVARNRAVLERLSRPSAATVRRTVAATARRHGVDPSLALAVAAVESGFRQHVISPTNAIGTMQIIPLTGRWLSTMAGRQLDVFRLQDNVTAGVLLLRWLLAETPNQDVAIAAYYQGLTSVRRNGVQPAGAAYLAKVRAAQQQLR